MRFHQGGTYLEESEEKLLDSLQHLAANLDDRITLECNNEKSILVGQCMVPKSVHHAMVKGDYEFAYNRFDRMKFDINIRAKIMQLQQGIIEGQIHLRLLESELGAVQQQSYQEPPHLIRTQAGMSTENAGSEKAAYSQDEGNRGTKRKADNAD